MNFDKNELYSIESNIDGERISLYEVASWKNGLAFKNIDFSDSGMPIIKIAELNNGISSSTAYTNKEYNNDVFLTKGDFVFSWSGNPYTSIDIFRYNLPDGWLNQHIFKVVPNDRLIIKNYFFYLMKFIKPNFIKIATNKQTTGLGHVTLNDIKQINFKLPDFDTQHKISKILCCIDEKIQINHATNNNLEQQAMALFKSWFIDFEPFGGTIPDDWSEGILGNFIEIKRGGSPRPIQDYLADTGYRWLKISDATSIQSPFILNIKEHIKESGINKTILLKAGSLVLSNSATPGIPKILDVDSCIHDGWLYFPKSKLSNEYLYLLFKFNRPNLVALGNGSVFTNLKTDILRNYNTVLPDKETLTKFDRVASSIFNQILCNTRENEKLAQLRDTLLPKLMSGEIDVSNVEIKDILDNDSTDKLSFSEVQ